MTGFEVSINVLTPFGFVPVSASWSTTPSSWARTSTGIRRGTATRCESPSRGRTRSRTWSRGAPSPVFAAALSRLAPRVYCPLLVAALRWPLRDRLGPKSISALPGVGVLTATAAVGAPFGLPVHRDRQHLVDPDPRRGCPPRATWWSTRILRQRHEADVRRRGRPARPGRRSPVLRPAVPDGRTNTPPNPCGGRSARCRIRAAGGRRRCCSSGAGWCWRAARARTRRSCPGRRRRRNGVPLAKESVREGRLGAGRCRPAVASPRMRASVRRIRAQPRSRPLADQRLQGALRRMRRGAAALEGAFGRLRAPVRRVARVRRRRCQGGQGRGPGDREPEPCGGPAAVRACVRRWRREALRVPGGAFAGVDLRLLEKHWTMSNPGVCRGIHLATKTCTILVHRASVSILTR